MDILKALKLVLYYTKIKVLDYLLLDSITSYYFYIVVNIYF